MNSHQLQTDGSDALPPLGRIEGREWWLWGFAVIVTLVLTLGIVALTFPGLHLLADRVYTLNLREWVRGLVALVLMFDIYTMYQHLLLQRLRRELAKKNRLFRLISENAADMIGVVDVNGHRLYNSPAYSRVLGYSPEELAATSGAEQIHPEDRTRVTAAAEKARLTGTGERLEYRIRHKDGSWRVLESTASAIRGPEGKIEGLVIVNRDITDRRHAEDLLVHNALHDGLTDLPNRALFLDRLGRAMAVSRRHADFKFAVLFVDIDGFKVVNDSLGHTAGDALLVQIANRLGASCRRSDTVSRASHGDAGELPVSESTLARPGGDEFVLLAEELCDPSDAVRVAKRIQQRLSVPFQLDDHTIGITASIGIVFKSRVSAETPEELLRDAEIAMYRAKFSGKACYEVFDNAMHAKAVERLRLETEMRQALERREFIVYYQPIVSLATKQIVGFEALTRWERPDGMLLPADFMTVANETGIIVSINQQLMLEAFQQLRQWQEIYPSDPPLAMSVNIAPKQFQLMDLSEQIGRILEETSVDPRSINLEITETAAMADADRSAVVLRDLKALGVHLEIDDFGTGYSSLSRLQQLPVDTLKIDRSFISQMDADADTREIVRIIVMLAQNLGLKVVAEGVETEAQSELLRQISCGLAQGYLFSRPTSAPVAGGLLAACRSLTTTVTRVEVPLTRTGLTERGR